jgi:hypothetical protein
MPDHGYFANLIWQIADVLSGPDRPPPLLKERGSSLISAAVTGQIDVRSAP